MNKVIVTLLLLLSASAVTPAWSSKTSVSMKGDTTTVIEDGDTTRVVGGINIGKIIERVPKTPRVPPMMPQPTTIGKPTCVRAKP